MSSINPDNYCKDAINLCFHFCSFLWICACSTRISYLLELHNPWRNQVRVLQLDCNLFCRPRRNQANVFLLGHKVIRRQIYLPETSLYQKSQYFCYIANGNGGAPCWKQVWDGPAFLQGGLDLLGVSCVWSLTLKPDSSLVLPVSCMLFVCFEQGTDHQIIRATMRVMCFSGVLSSFADR